MAKLRCPCGGLISDSGDFNQNKAIAVRDVDYSAQLASEDWESRMRAVVQQMRSAGETELYRQVLSAALELLWDRQFDLFECTGCGRIAMETAPGSNRFRFYFPESDDRSVFAVSAASDTIG